MNPAQIRKTDIKSRLVLFAVGFLVVHLGIQFHEALHWLVAVLLGVKVTLVTSSDISFGTIGRTQQIILSAAGTLATLIYIAAGLLMYRSSRTAVKKFGFLIAFTNSFGRVGYELAELFIPGHGVDETNIARQLGISDLSIRIPVTAACVLAGIYLFIRDKETSRKDPGWIIPVCSSVPAYAAVLLLTSYFKIQARTGGSLFQPILMGYPPFLVIFNLLQLSALCLLLPRRTSSSAAILLAVAALNIGVAGAAAVRVGTYDACEGTPRVIDISPESGGLEALNQTGQKITIRFDRAMEANVPSFGRNISYDPERGKEPLNAVWAWPAPDTLELRLNREVYPGEDVELTIEYLRDASGIQMCSPIHLEYE